MKTLIVEDDFTSRLLLQEILSRYGVVHVAVNGKEAIAAARDALDAGARYDLICLDIMMPEMDGYEVLRQIRGYEESRDVPSTKGSKIFMVTAVHGLQSVSQAFQGLCDSYVLKPVDKAKLLALLEEFGLIDSDAAATLSRIL